MKHLKHPATIIAAVALFVALGGGAVAYAAGVINGSQIKNHSIASEEAHEEGDQAAARRQGRDRSPPGPPGAPGAPGEPDSQGPGGHVIDSNATAVVATRHRPRSARHSESTLGRNVRRAASTLSRSGRDGSQLVATRRPFLAVGRSCMRSRSVGDHSRGNPALLPSSARRSRRGGASVDIQYQFLQLGPARPASARTSATTTSAPSAPATLPSSRFPRHSPRVAGAPRAGTSGSGGAPALPASVRPSARHPVPRSAPSGGRDRFFVQVRAGMPERLLHAGFRVRGAGQDEEEIGEPVEVDGRERVRVRHGQDRPLGAAADRPREEEPRGPLAPPGRTKLLSSGSAAFAASISCSSRSIASSVTRSALVVPGERDGQVGAEIEQLVLDAVEAAGPADERVELVDVAHRCDPRVELRDARAVAEARLPLVAAARVDARQADGLVRVAGIARSLRRVIRRATAGRRRGDRRDLRAVVRAARLPAAAAHARGAPRLLRPLRPRRRGVSPRCAASRSSTATG